MGARSAAYGADVAALADVVISACRSRVREPPLKHQAVDRLWSFKNIRCAGIARMW